MHRYETLFILSPDLPEAQVRETIDRTRRLIEGMSGEVEEIQDWGLRELAYLIQKRSRGNYVLAQYRGSSSVVNELERTLRISDEVLRYTSVRIPEGIPMAPPTPPRVDVPVDEDTDLDLDGDLS